MKTTTWPSKYRDQNVSTVHDWWAWISHTPIGSRAHYITVSKVQWKPFWLATQLYPQNDWTGWQFPVYSDIRVQAPFNPTRIPETWREGVLQVFQRLTSIQPNTSPAKTCTRKRRTSFHKIRWWRRSKVTIRRGRCSEMAEKQYAPPLFGATS